MSGTTDDPPPIEIDNKFAWWLALSPIILLLLVFMSNENLSTIIVAVLQFSFVYFDYKTVKEANYNPPHLAWFLIPIVYLWKRDLRLKNNKTYVWAYIISVLAYVLISQYSA